MRLDETGWAELIANIVFFLAISGWDSGENH